MNATSRKLDRIDIKILHELQKDGRIANVELAKAVGLSPSPCLTRVKRLRETGYITAYTTQIDVARLGEVVTVFTEITLSNHRHVDFSRFEAEIARHEEVIECHLVSGGYDYLLKFVTRGLGHYQEKIDTLLELNIGIDK